MKKSMFLILMFLLPSLVNAANLSSKCQVGSNEELDNFMKNHFNYLYTRYDKKYAYVAYCVDQYYEFPETVASNTLVLHGCVFNRSDNFDLYKSNNCAYYFNVYRNEKDLYYFSLMSSSGGYTFIPDYRLMHYELNQINVSVGDVTVTPGEGSEAASVDLSELKPYFMLVAFASVLVFLAVMWKRRSYL